MKLYGTIRGHAFIADDEEYTVEAPNLEERDQKRIVYAMRSMWQERPHSTQVNAARTRLRRAFGQEGVIITGVDYGEGNGIEEPDFAQVNVPGRIY